MTRFRVLIHLYNLRFFLSSCDLFHTLKVKCQVSVLLTIGRVIQAPIKVLPFNRLRRVSKYKYSAHPSPQSGTPAARRRTKPPGKHRIRGQKRDLSKLNFVASFYTVLCLTLSIFYFPLRFSLSSKWLVARSQGCWLRCASAAQSTACQRRAKDKLANIRCILCSTTPLLRVSTSIPLHITNK